jgi:hypothetical protein
MNLGLDSGSKILSAVPFPIDVYYKEFKKGDRPHPFCEGYLTKVEKQTRVAEKYVLLDGVVLEADTKPTAEQVTPESRRHILVFSFSDSTNTYTHNEELWDGEVDKVKWKIDHITAQTMAAYVGQEQTFKLLSGDGLNAKVPEATKSFSAWFRAIAAQFNTGKDGKPVFKTEDDKMIPVRFKLTRQTVGKGTNNLQLSTNGNTIERISSNAAIKSILTISATGKNPDKFEIIESGASKSSNNPVAPISDNNGSNAGGWPEGL